MIPDTLFGVNKCQLSSSNGLGFMMLCRSGGQASVTESVTEVFVEQPGSVKNKHAAQAAVQTLPDATPPVGKIHSFSKIAVTNTTI